MSEYRKPQNGRQLLIFKFLFFIYSLYISIIALIPSHSLSQFLLPLSFPRPPAGAQPPRGRGDGGGGGARRARAEGVGGGVVSERPGPGEPGAGGRVSERASGQTSKRAHIQLLSAPD